MATNQEEKRTPQVSGSERPIWNNETAISSITPYLAEIYLLLISKTGNTFNWEWVVSEAQRSQALGALGDLRAALGIDDEQFTDALLDASDGFRRIPPPSEEERLETLREHLVEQFGVTTADAQRFIEEFEGHVKDEPPAEEV